MRSSTESFWKAVDQWCFSDPKPRIRADGASGNWSAFTAEGVIEGFAVDSFIDFLRDDGKLLHFVLCDCSLRVRMIPHDLREMDVSVRFSLVCDEEDGGVTRFTFSELRRFEQSN